MSGISDSKIRCFKIGRGWTTVFLLWFVGVLNYADRQLPVSMAAAIMDDFRIGSRQFALLSSVYLWVYAFASPLAGFLSDRIGYARAVVFGLATWSILTFGIGLVRSFESMLVLRILLAAAESFAIPAGAAMIAGCCRPSGQALALAVYFTGSMVGCFVGAIGGWIAQYLAWPFAFYCFGSIGIFYAVFLFFTLREPMRSANARRDVIVYRKQSIVDVFSKRLLILMLAYGILGAGNWILVSWLPHYFHVERSCDLARAAFYGMGVLSLASVTGMLVIGFLSDRLESVWNVRRAFVPAAALLSTGPLLFSIAWIESLSWILMILFAVCFVKGGVSPNLMPILCRTISPEQKATAFGLLNFTATLVGGTAIYVVGFLKDGGIALIISFQISAILLFLSGIIFLYLGFYNGEEVDAGAVVRTGRAC